MNKPFNYFKLISDEIMKAQEEKLYELKDLNLNIYKTGGEVYILNNNKDNRKLGLRQRLPKLMAVIFKRLILKYGAAITNVEMIVPKKILKMFVIYVPITFKVGQVRINSSGEGKLYVGSKKFAHNHLVANFDGTFPFKHSRVTGISINLKAMEDNYKISNENFDIIRTRILES
jgi:hypothetical protein